MIPLYRALANGTKYKIYLTADDGTRLGRPLSTVVGFSYTSAVNALGAFSLDLPKSFNRTLLAYDRRVFFWRRAPGGAFYIDFEGIINKITTWADDNGNLFRRAEGEDLNRLLSGRVVAYAAGTAQADQTDQGDDMLKVLARQNLGSTATDTARAISSAVFTVAGDDAAAPSQTKSMSYRKLLDVMVEIASSARQAGTEVYFGVVPTGETTFQFQTFIGQPGRDRTSDQVKGLTFSLTRKNLYRPQLVEDASREINYAYALNQSTTQTATDAVRAGRSLFGRREGIINSSGQGTTGAAGDANAAVIAGRPLTIFTGEFLSVPGSVYGKDWYFGDRVSVTFDGRNFDALARARTITVAPNGNESLKVLSEAYL